MLTPLNGFFKDHSEIILIDYSSAILLSYLTYAVTASVSAISAGTKLHC